MRMTFKRNNLLAASTAFLAPCQVQKDEKKLFPDQSADMLTALPRAFSTTFHLTQLYSQTGALKLCVPHISFLQIFVAECVLGLKRPPFNLDEYSSWLFNIYILSHIMGNRK